MARRPALKQVDAQQQGERDHEHQCGERRRSGVVVLLELGDDEERDDFRLEAAYAPRVRQKAK